MKYSCVPKWYSSIVVALALVACATLDTTPAASLARATNAYNAAAQTIVAYKSLAPCGSPLATQLCSDPAIVQQMKLADDAAYKALVSAEAAVNAGASNAMVLLAAANAAANSLASQTATLKVKP